MVASTGILESYIGRYLRTWADSHGHQPTHDRAECSPTSADSCTVIRVTSPASDEQTAAALADMFGGRWVRWTPGAAGPAGTLWTRYGQVDGRWTVTGVLLLSDGVRTEDLRRVPIGALEVSMNVEQSGSAVDVQDVDDLPPLVRSPGTRPEDWSKLVAAHYTAWARRGANPGAEMARRWGVNRQTVAAWIREARLRGMLPPARRPKTGGE